jgi:ferritin-like metal-binding protein YciE
MNIELLKNTIAIRRAAITEKMQKAIPEIPRKNEQKMKAEALPSDVKKFKEEIEEQVSEIEKIIDELVKKLEKTDEQSMAEMKANWLKFRNQFEYSLNEAVRGWYKNYAVPSDNGDRISFRGKK